jgi:hypothetical protein
MRPVVRLTGCHLRRMRGHKDVPRVRRATDGTAVNRGRMDAPCCAADRMSSSLHSRALSLMVNKPQSLWLTVVLLVVVVCSAAVA